MNLVIHIANVGKLPAIINGTANISVIAERNAYRVPDRSPYSQAETDIYPSQTNKVIEWQYPTREIKDAINQEGGNFLLLTNFYYYASNDVDKRWPYYYSDARVLSPNESSGSVNLNEHLE